MNNEQKERRERIATAVLAGLCANPTPFQTDRQLIREALDISDALIRALDCERGTGADSVQNGGYNGEANAHLMAASKELYAALVIAREYASEEIARRENAGMDTSLDIQYLKQIDAALAKARGEAGDE